MATTRIGISGWNYPPWRGIFYPKGLRQADELAFVARLFSSIEVNGSFYSLQRPDTYTRWHDQTPSDFTFALKGPRYITHMKKLRDIERALANFFASGLFCLRGKLGPILWQLPPWFAYDEERLRSFFEVLPRTIADAAVLAAKRDPWLKDRATSNTSQQGPLRYALEVRHKSFLDRSFPALLAEYSIAACIADAAGLYPVIDDVTADFVYVRLHGAKRLYASGYGEKALRQWAARIERWQAANLDVYVYFDNDIKVRAPFDAENLARIVAGEHPKRLPAALRTVREPPPPVAPGKWR